MKRNGFTLLEIIIVLFLVTLMVGLSGIFVAGSLPTAKFTAAGREISGMIRHARSLARLNMENRSVIIDLDNRSYGIAGVSTNYLPPDATVKIIDPFIGEITRGTYPITFTAAGGVQGGTIIISREKKVIRIELDPITGAVLIKGGYR
jgi:prepilin-type N-terminal cleavage/methylation domain-containing protein